MRVLVISLTLLVAVVGSLARTLEGGIGGAARAAVAVLHGGMLHDPLSFFPRAWTQRVGETPVGEPLYTFYAGSYILGENLRT